MNESVLSDFEGACPDTSAPGIQWSTCYSYDELDTEDIVGCTPIPVADEASSNTSSKLSSSRSCSSIEIPCLVEDATNDKSLLPLPRPLRRSLSTENAKARLSKSLKPQGQSAPWDNKRSRTLQPSTNSLWRTRSTSPLFKQSVRKTFSLGISASDGTKFALARTVRFLSRKSSGASSSASATVRAQKEFVWHSPHNAGSTSDLAETPVTMNAVESWQLDTHNGIETPIAATHVGQLGSTPGSTSNGNSMPGDVADGIPTPNDPQREHLRQKIMKISEQIKIEQSSRDDNVAEYLKLANNADKQQAARIKSVFEKKNQKSKATVAMLQKKLETYHRRLREIENSGSKAQSGKYGLKEVGAKLTDFSGGVVGSVKQGLLNSSKLINKKFGSVDNIASLKEDFTGSEDLERSNSVGSAAASTSDSGEMEYNVNQGVMPPQSRQVNVVDINNRIEDLERQINRTAELEIQQERLKGEIEQLSIQIKRDIGILTNNFEEGSYRCARLEDQIHDLSEMHHRELGDVKQDVAGLEEKLEYHSQERARDIQEALESCQTRISKMEVQQQHQLQQLVTMEGVENATARSLIGKLINLLLSVLAVILVFVSTVSSIVMPLIRNQTRAIITCLCVLMIAVLYRNWEEPWTASISEFFWLGRWQDARNESLPKL